MPRLADWCAVELPDDGGSSQQVALAHADPARVEQARALRARYPPDPDAPLGTYAVMRSGEPQLIPEVPDELLVEAARDAEHLELIRALGIRSGMSVPMIAGGRVLGVMTFVFSESGRCTASRTSRSRRTSPRAPRPRSRTPASTPSAPRSRARCRRACCRRSSRTSPGWRFAADYRPGQRGADVGGDFYDVFAVPAGRWCCWAT